MSASNDWYIHSCIGDPEKRYNLLESLADAKVFQFGDFTLQSGMHSPIYLDLRQIISSPEIMRTMACFVTDMMLRKRMEVDYLVGVPLAALPITSIMSERANIPMLLLRKEAKQYGGKKELEGTFKQGKRVLVMEDVVVSGASIALAVKALRKNGLECNDAICLIDREQGAPAQLAADDITLHSLLKITDVIEHLVTAKRITNDKKEEIIEYIKRSQCSPAASPKK